ncbi:MAG: FAD-binding oxidoreductase, partial [Myxococcota bacterium]
MTAQEILAGWGNYPRVMCDVARPEQLSDIHRAITTDGTCARGLGRSYGDQATNAGGRVLDMTGVDRYLGFDPDTGVLRCEAGVSLRQIIHDLGPRGWFPMITPGTKFVTVGGCIANDIHGKAQHVDGTFSNCTEQFTLLCADGQVRTCSREENTELFWANFGGLGLLGVILTATIRLRRIETTYFVQRAIEVKDLDALLEAFETYDTQYPYSVAWINAISRGSRLGEGVLTVGDHAKLDDLPTALKREPLRITPPSPLVVPFEMPEFALNPATLRILNMVIRQVQARGGAIAHYEKFFYPLDFVGEWNRGYGRRGFTQYQFVVPLEEAEAM